MLKKHRTIVEVIVLSLMILMWIKSLFYIMENRDRIVFMNLLYDHIDYNGNAYYMSENQYWSIPGKSKKGTPVYLVYKGDKIYYEGCSTAEVFTGYEGEEEEIYIFFDSAIHIREDYRYLEDNLE